MFLLDKKGHLSRSLHSLLSKISTILCPHRQYLKGGFKVFISEYEPPNHVVDISVLCLGHFRCSKSELGPERSSVNIFPFLCRSPIL